MIAEKGGDFVVLPNDPSLLLVNEFGKRECKWSVVTRLLGASITTADQLVVRSFVNFVCLPQNLVALLAKYLTLKETLAVLAPQSNDPKANKELVRGIGSFVNQLSPEPQKEFFDVTLPYIQHLVLTTPQYVHRIPFLDQGKAGSVTFHKRVIASILACAFFGLWPRQTPKEGGQEIPFLSMVEWYRVDFSGTPPNSQMAKIRCLVHYFQRISQECMFTTLTGINFSLVPEGFVTFSRCILNEEIDWENSNKKIMPVRVHDRARIEDFKECAHTDFANKYLGGGVMRTVCLREFQF